MRVEIHDLAVPTVNLGELMQLRPDLGGGPFWRSDEDEAKAWGTFMLTERLRFAVDGTEYVIPKGFLTDHASVPRPLWWLYPRNGRKYATAAVVHDWLYSTVSGMDRATADRAFLVAMRCLGVPAVRSFILWAAVRLGGRSAWRRGQEMGAADPLWRVLV